MEQKVDWQPAIPEGFISLRVIQLLPADGWWAVFNDAYNLNLALSAPSEEYRKPIIAFALVEQQFDLYGKTHQDLKALVCDVDDGGSFHFADDDHSYIRVERK